MPSQHAPNLSYTYPGCIPDASWLCDGILAVTVLYKPFGFSGKRWKWTTPPLLRSLSPDCWLGSGRTAAGFCFVSRWECNCYVDQTMLAWPQTTRFLLRLPSKRAGTHPPTAQHTPSCGVAISLAHGNPPTSLAHPRAGASWRCLLGCRTAYSLSKDSMSPAILASPPAPLYSNSPSQRYRARPCLSTR